MRRSLVIALALLAVAFVFVGGPSLLLSAAGDEATPQPDDEPEPELVTLEDSESGFWPYLNVRRAHEMRSPINVVVRGDADGVLRLLSEHGDGDWQEPEHDHFEADELLDGNETAVENGTATEPEREEGDPPEANTTSGPDAESRQPIAPTAIPWSQADGATRYAYVDPGPGEEAYWTTETLQFEDGEYYGYRYHIRAYESPNPEDEWVAMQTHSEHFDWFTLRHRVDGSQKAQAHLESDLMAVPGIDPQEDVRRMYLGNGRRSDADGWATVVELTTVALVPVGLGLAAKRRRDAASDAASDATNDAASDYPDVVERAGAEVGEHLSDADRERLVAAVGRIEARHLILAATILALVLGVRITGIALDRSVDSLSAHAIAALLYPFIGVGLPVATYGIATGLERRLDAALVTAISLASAIWIDYGLLGVDVLPIEVILQRALVVVALGLIAAGAVSRATRSSRLNDILVGGVTMWVIVLGATLLGYV